MTGEAPAAERVVEQMRITVAPGVELAATLHTPRGHGPGPFPVVLAIPGGGPGGRHTYDVLKERFLHDGIAMLEYDKRGVWQSSGAQSDRLSVQEEDAMVVLAFTRALPQLDEGRIALLGLCQGAVIGPAVAARTAGLVGVVMLSGPVGKGPSVYLTQMADYLAAGGAPQPAIVRLTDAAGALLEARARDAGPADIASARQAMIDGFVAIGFSVAEAEGALAVIDNAESLDMWNGHFDETLARVRAPVLALYGSVDIFVTPADNVPVARLALAGNPDGTVIEMPRMNHVFQYGTTGTLAEIREQGTPNCAPEMIELVGDWLHERMKARQESRQPEPLAAAGRGATVARP